MYKYICLTCGEMKEAEGHSEEYKDCTCEECREGEKIMPDKDSWWKGEPKDGDSWWKKKMCRNRPSIKEGDST